MYPNSYMVLDIQNGEILKVHVLKLYLTDSLFILGCPSESVNTEFS